MLAKISSASLVQANGCGWSLHESMNAPMAATSSPTEVNEPRRMAWRVMTEKKIILSLAVCGRADLGGRVEDGDLDASAARSGGPA